MDRCVCMIMCVCLHACGVKGQPLDAVPQASSMFCPKQCLLSKVAIKCLLKLQKALVSVSHVPVAGMDYKHMSPCPDFYLRPEDQTWASHL